MLVPTSYIIIAVSRETDEAVKFNRFKRKRVTKGKVNVV